jgi:hypothetical protein
MRLLNVHDYGLHTFYGDEVPRYAILSHTWLNDNEEVTFAQLKSDLRWRDTLGARKIIYLCQQAADDGYSYAWIDTCCIDKTNNAELSEAINSMFQWYQKAEVCYVYLMDIHNNQGDDFLSSRWWSRAWTLQELVAPATVRFYDGAWQSIGSKRDMAERIANKSGIDARVLYDSHRIPFRSVASRMSWAAHRQAKRVEDLAYSLLGIFNINMAMQYGEGDKAFTRLQKEILHSTNDLSILAWNFTPRTFEDLFSKENNSSTAQGTDSGKMTVLSPQNTVDCDFFAPDPSSFAGSRNVKFLRWHSGNAHVKEQYGYLKITAPLFLPVDGDSDVLESPQLTYPVVVLPCSTNTASHCLVGILLRKWHGSPIYPDNYRAIRCSFTNGVHACLIRSDCLAKAQNTKIRIFSSIMSARLARGNLLTIYRTLLVKFDNMRKYKVEIQSLDHPSTNWTNDSKDPYIFRRDDTVWVSTNTIMRVFNGQSSLYIGFVNSNSLNKVEQPIVVSKSSEHSAADAIELIKHSLFKNIVVEKITSLGLGRKTELLYADLVTRFTFNQAVTTLTLVKWDNKLHGDFYDRRPSARAVSVSSGVWQAS